MKIEYYHASRFGNGERVAEEFARQASSLGSDVDVHHIREVDPTNLTPADLHVFSSPGQWGKPIKKVRNFLSRVSLPAGTKYAILTTEIAPTPDKKTGVMPTEEERAKWQRVRPIMNELLEAAGLTKVAEEAVHVTEIKGPLEDGWEAKVEAFARHVVTTAKETQPA
jgi:sulfite reductase alpha subunit-like flavoprotein